MIFFLTWEFTFEFSFFFSSSHEPWDARHVQRFLVVRKHHIFFQASPHHFGRLHQESFKSVRWVTLCEKEGGSERAGESPRVSGIQWWCLPEDGSKDGTPDEHFPSVITEHARLTQTEHSYPRWRSTHIFKVESPAVSAEKSRSGR